jgi:hypothetical protein
MNAEIFPATCGGFPRVKLRSLRPGPHEWGRARRAWMPRGLRRAEGRDARRQFLPGMRSHANQEEPGRGYSFNPAQASRNRGRETFCLFQALAKIAGKAANGHGFDFAGGGLTHNRFYPRASVLSGENGFIGAVHCAKKGLCFSSCATVVRGPWPGASTVSRGRVKIFCRSLSYCS